ncbi:MAG: hypothetical protein RRY20_05100 [Bilophila sp.]
MKVDTSLPIQQIAPDRANTTRQETSGKTTANGFASQFSTPESAVVTNEGLSVRDRASFSSKSLSVSAALAGTQTGSSAAPSSTLAAGSSSSSIVSSQAEPFLSADEVSFFEKMMRKAASGYTRNGAYGQSAAAMGTSLALKI